jgi:AraC-like DNA-binding protein
MTRDVVPRAQHDEAVKARENLSLAWLVANDCADSEQVALSKRIFGRALPRLRLGPSGGAPFGARIMLGTRPNLGVVSCFQPVEHWERLPSAGDETARILLVRPADASIRVSQGGRSVMVGTRGAVLVSGSAAASFHLAQSKRVDCYTFPQSILSDMGAKLDEWLMHPIPRDSEALQLFGHYSGGMLRGALPINTPAPQALTTAHFHDLVKLAFAPGNRAMPEAPPPRHRRMARLDAIKADVDLGLGRRDLTTDLIARLHRVTPRYVQKLFETEGTTFSQFVLERRLERAQSLLRSPEHMARSISEVAYEVGFGDLSYFNRSFRKRYGVTPSEMRRAQTDAAT